MGDPRQGVPLFLSRSLQKNSYAILCGMTLQEYKSQGHPLARMLPGGEVDDVHPLVVNWAEKEGFGLLENGGEFDTTDPASLDYALYDDEGGEHWFTLSGNLVGDVLEIESIRLKDV